MIASGTRTLARTIVVAGSAVLGATLHAAPAHAAPVGALPTDAAVTTTWTSEAVLVPGERPGPFFGAPDRSRGNKYGAWTDETEAQSRWVLEAPRGPWDTLEIVDRPGVGQRFDCAAGVRVRATADVDPTTGYLLDPVELPLERVEVACSDTEATVRVAPVGDEIVEVTLTSTLAQPSTVATNVAVFAATRSVPGAEPTPPVVEPTAPAATPPAPAPSEQPVPTGEPGATAEPAPAGEASVAPTSAAMLPARLAETGADAVWLPVGAATALVVIGAATIARSARRAGGRA